MLHFHMAAALMSYHKSLNTLRYIVKQEKIALCHVLQLLFPIARPWDQHKHKSTEFWRSKIQEENANKESAYMVSLAIAKQEKWHYVYDSINSKTISQILVHSGVTCLLLSTTSSIEITSNKKNEHNIKQTFLNMKINAPFTFTFGVVNSWKDNLKPCIYSTIHRTKKEHNVQEITRPSEFISKPDGSSILLYQKVMNFQLIISQLNPSTNFPLIRHHVQPLTSIKQWARLNI